MKQISIIALACVVLTLLSACGGKKKSEDIIAPKVEKVKPKAPVAMQEYTDERDVEWIGKIYHVAIHRHASDSLRIKTMCSPLPYHARMAPYSSVVRLPRSR